MRTWLVTLGLLSCAGLLQAQEPVAIELPNASFEVFADGVAPGWELVPTGRSEGTLEQSDEALSGEHGLIIGKTNGLDYIMLVSAEPIPVEPGAVYESTVRLRVLERQFGATIYFCNQDFDGEGKVLYPVHYSPHHTRVPAFSRAGEWFTLPAEWTTDARAAATQLRLIITGNPARYVLDDIALVKSPVHTVNKATLYGGREPYDEAAARANLARRSAEPARIEMRNGRPTIIVGDRAMTPLIHHCCYGIPLLSRYGGFGRAGVHLHTLTVEFDRMDRENSVWPYPNDPDFSFVEEALLRIIGSDPEACVIITPSVDMPRQWGLDHPDQVWTDADGGKLVCAGCKALRIGEPQTPDEFHPASYGSPLYRETMGRNLRLLGEWLRDHEAGKIVVGFMIAGGSDGQFFSWWRNALDRSPGSVAGWHEWLRAEYGGDEARLREAWGDAQVSFETAELPAEEERSAVDDTRPEGIFISSQRVIDANRYQMEAPVELVRGFARALKEGIGRPTFAMQYYPDAIHDQGMNKYAASALFAGDVIDAATAVQEYGGWREPGATGGTNSSWAAMRLRGKLQVAELDYRTYRSHMGGSWDVGALGATLTAEGFRSQVVRDICAQASRGMGAWFYDMGGHWYDGDDIWATISEAARILGWAHRPEAPSPVAELAVFVDEAVGARISHQHWGVLNTQTNAARIPLNLSGVPYDLYFLQDIADPDLPDYKAYLFLTAFTLTAEQGEAIKTRCRRPGRVLAFYGPPGGADAAYAEHTSCLRDLTGLQFELLPAGTGRSCVPVGGDAMAEGLEAAPIGSGEWALATPVCTDARAVAISRYLDGDRPAHIVWRGDSGTVVYIPPGGLTPMLIANLAREAGVQMRGTPGQVWYVGGGVACAHHARPGEAAVDFTAPVDLVDPLTGQVTRRAVRQWQPEGELLSTSVTYYR